jgi:hypothetical protein
LIYDRLIRLGYEFEHPERALFLKGAQSYEDVDAFESELSTLPIVLRECYSRVISLDFSQSDDQYFDRSSALAGLGWHCELLLIGLEDAKIARDECQVTRARVRANFEAQDFHLPPDDPSPLLLTGGCAGNNVSDAIALPCRSFDVCFRNDGLPRTVNKFLRNAISHAGFPTLVTYDKYLRETIGSIPGSDRALPSKNFPRQGAQSAGGHRSVRAKSRAALSFAPSKRGLNP